MPQTPQILAENPGMPAALTRFAVRWGSPGTPVLAPHLGRALGSRRCPDAIAHAFDAEPTGRWAQLRWPTDPVRREDGHGLLDWCGPLVQDLPLLDLRFDTREGRRLLTVILSPQVEQHLVIADSARLLLEGLDDPGELWRATLGSTLARRILHAGLAQVLELSFALNTALALLADLQEPRPAGLVAGLCAVAGRRPAQHGVRVPAPRVQATTPEPPAVVPLPGPVPLWATRLRVDDVRFADLVPSAAVVLPAGSVFATAYSDPLAAVVLAPSIEPVAARAARLRGLGLELQVTDLLLAVLGMDAAVRARVLASTRHGWGGALAQRMGLLGPGPGDGLDGRSRSDYGGEHGRRTERQVRARLAAGGSWWLPGLEEALGLLAGRLPLTDRQAGALLARHRLAGEGMTGGALLRIAALVGTDPGAVAARAGVLFDPAHPQLARLGELVRQHSAGWGMTQVARVEAHLRTAGVPPVPEAALRHLLGADSTIRQAPGGWLWPATPHPGDPLERVLRQLLSVHAPQSIASLHGGLVRAWGQQRHALVPEPRALRAYLREHPGFQLSRDGLTRPTQELDYRAELGPQAAALVDVLRTAPRPAVDLDMLLTLAQPAGLNRPAVVRLLPGAAFLEAVGDHAWTLRGTLGPNAHARLNGKRTPRAPVPARNGRTATGWERTGPSRLQITTTLSGAAWTDGVVYLPQALAAELDQTTFTLTSGVTRRLSVSGAPGSRRLYGWRSTARALGVRAGDTLLIDLDLNTRTATVTHQLAIGAGSLVAPGLERIPPGVQPEADGRLQCLECGRWYRQLGQHLTATHDLHPDDYRRSHQLPRSRGLHAADILQRRSQRGKQHYTNDPDALLRQLTPTQTTLEQRVALSRAARSESAKRAGSRTTARQNGARVHQAWLASIDERFTEHARRLGHPDITALLETTRALSDPAFGRLVGVTTKQAANFRRRHAIPAPGRWPADRVPKHLHLRPPMDPNELAAIAPGRQPAWAGHLLCRECGRWYRSLPQHLTAAHHLTSDAYRTRHHLAPTVRLRGIGPQDTDGADPTAQQRAEDQQRQREARQHAQAEQRASPTTPTVPLDLPPGIQPERDDALQCRECGHWFKGLGAHLAHKHHLSAADYRTRYGLPIRRSLDAATYTAARRAAGQRRYAQDPEALRTMLTPTRSTPQERLTRSIAARKESAQRPGTRHIAQEAGRRGGAQAHAKSREADNARARAAGYPDVTALLEATAHLNGHDFATLLDISYYTGSQLRRRHGYHAPGQRRTTQTGLTTPKPAAHTQSGPPGDTHPADARRLHP
ncbi:MucR family transcriptional regulator [Streptacidiphilus sp. MAP12-16]|uniref:MucR family transcriptional regulator n=1 Tax=Streptacidiphilus sp. MAP12-16 TaxID=3156300 RepID=UPI003512211F